MWNRNRRSGCLSDPAGLISADCPRAEAVSMFTVSLLIEILRTRPRLVFWLAALTQGFLWVLVPTLFYSAPPGELAEVLAVGREYAFGSKLGPPLAFWLAELSLRVSGGHMFGVYLLAQVCVVTTYWAIFRLGQAIVGDRHAVLAILLMTGISLFTVGSPAFGPDILLMPLWALALLFLWRAIGGHNELCWFAVAAMFGLMLLTSYVALILILLTGSFLLGTARGRAAMRAPAAIASALIVALLTLPTFVLLNQYGSELLPALERLRRAQDIDHNLLAWIRLLAVVAVSHAGAAILIVLASNLLRTRRIQAAMIVRMPVDPFARNMVYYFAIAPLLVATGYAVITGNADSAGIEPLLVLSGLAIVIAAGDVILVHHQRLLSVAWVSLLIVPPVLAALATLVLPSLFAIDLKVAQPADRMARFFTESFERRTGRKLDIVGGDPRIATLIALGSNHRPRVLHTPDLRLPNLATAEEAMTNGAVIVWRATDGAGTPPPDVKAMFPQIVPEVPRVFERPLSGRAPVTRIGWGVIRPRGETPPAPAAPPAASQ